MIELIQGSKQPSSPGSSETGEELMMTDGAFSEKLAIAIQQFIESGQQEAAGFYEEEAAKGDAAGAELEELQKYLFETNNSGVTAELELPVHVLAGLMNAAGIIADELPVQESENGMIKIPSRFFSEQIATAKEANPVKPESTGNSGRLFNAPEPSVQPKVIETYKAAVADSDAKKTDSSEDLSGGAKEQVIENSKKGGEPVQKVFSSPVYGDQQEDINSPVKTGQSEGKGGHAEPAVVPKIEQGGVSAATQSIPASELKKSAQASDSNKSGDKSQRISKLPEAAETVAVKAKTEASAEAKTELQPAEETSKVQSSVKAEPVAFREIQGKTGPEKIKSAPPEQPVPTVENSETGGIQKSIVTGSTEERGFVNKILQTVRKELQGVQQEARTWKTHQFVLDDGSKVNLGIRRAEGLLQLQLGSGNTDLNRLIQQHAAEIRDYLEKEMDLEVDLQFEFTDSGSGADEHQPEAASAAFPAERRENGKQTGTDITPAASIRNFGFNKNEWTA